MKSNKLKNAKIDPLFDGHLEKQTKNMSASERIDYLWELVELRLVVTKRIKSSPVQTGKSNEKSK